MMRVLRPLMRPQPGHPVSPRNPIMKIRTAPALFAVLLTTLLVGQASAQTLLAPATAATTITLDAQASVELDNDRMHVTLGTSEDGEDTRVLTQRVLARLNQALAQVQ